MGRLTVVLATVAVAASGCSAFRESAERLSSPPAVTSSSPVTSPTFVATAADGLPVIVVDVPPTDAQVVSPLVVRGTAHVDGSVVHIRLTAEDGSLISGVDATARCQAGCRRDFRVTLYFFVDRVQPAMLELFADGGPDGSPTGIVQVPLTLFP